MSLLKELRGLMPARPLDAEEARWVAEHQALLMRRLLELTDEPFLPREAILSQPKIQVVLDDELAVSGSSHWTGKVWQITLRSSEAFTRQRFTLAHEFKHIVDSPFDEFCYPALHGQSREQRAESVCDYFAACLLMPKVLVRRAWAAGGDNQQPEVLARLFGVSPQAMAVRLFQLGLSDARLRCRSAVAPNLRQCRHYYRALSPTLSSVSFGSPDEAELTALAMVTASPVGV